MSYHRIFDGMTIDGQEVNTSLLKETGKVLIGNEEWDAKDLISEEDIKDVFNEDMLRTKDDILEDIEALLETISENKSIDNRHSQAYYTRYIELIKRFREKIESCVFPEQLEDWWHYEYEVQETGIVLTLSHEEHVDINNEGFIDTLFTDTAFNLVNISSELMTVEQFAQANGVTATAVRQWIRRGKIRSAVKQGSEWRIPELAEVRDRGYKFVQYKWEEYLTGFPEKYDFINEYNTISISQNDERKDLFDVIFSKTNEANKIQMSLNEKEKLELLLISNPLIHPETATIVHRG